MAIDGINIPGLYFLKEYGLTQTYYDSNGRPTLTAIDLRVAVSLKGDLENRECEDIYIVDQFWPGSTGVGEGGLFRGIRGDIRTPDNVRLFRGVNGNWERIISGNATAENAGALISKNKFAISENPIENFWFLNG